ncbi:hypothetical protein C0993_010711 [Termitomyces sp. T159_Od127]|nr:hypothetical protein C0993_010711 [Termitomyces sp. T159_Od127]
MAEAEPPFSKTQQLADRWPPLSRPHLLSPAYHEFLRLCSQPSSTRPSPSELTKVIIQLITRCITIEQDLPAGDVSVSRGFIQE